MEVERLLLTVHECIQRLHGNVQGYPARNSGKCWLNRRHDNIRSGFDGYRGGFYSSPSYLKDVRVSEEAVQVHLPKQLTHCLHAFIPSTSNSEATSRITVNYDYGVYSRPQLLRWLRCPHLDRYTPLNPLDCHHQCSVSEVETRD
jgi:hypothetical protein